jgi:hypothetical protein
MEQDVIFESSYFNWNFFGWLIILPIIYAFTIIKGNNMGPVSATLIYLSTSLLLCWQGSIGSKVTLTDESLIFYYPFRPFRRRVIVRTDDIDKLELSLGRGSDFLRIYYKDTNRKKRYGNPASRKEQKILKVKLEEKGIYVKMW